MSYKPKYTGKTMVRGSYRVPKQTRDFLDAHGGSSTAVQDLVELAQTAQQLVPNLQTIRHPAVQMLLAVVPGAPPNAAYALTLAREIADLEKQLQALQDAPKPDDDYETRKNTRTINELESVIAEKSAQWGALPDEIKVGYTATHGEMDGLNHLAQRLQGVAETMKQGSTARYELVAEEIGEVADALKAFGETYAELFGGNNG